MPRPKGYFKDLLDHMQEGCQLISFDWRYLYVNDAVAQHGRKEKEELLGRTMMEAYPGIENTHLFEVLTRSMESRESEKFLNEFEFPDGSTGWFELNIQPVPDGLFIISLDVTPYQNAKRKIETQLRRMQALRDIDLAILGMTDSRLLYDAILDKSMKTLEADIGSIRLLNSVTNLLEQKARNPARPTASPPLRVGESVTGKAVLQRRTVSAPLLTPDMVPPQMLSAYEYENIRSAYAAPLIVKGKTLGVLTVYFRNPIDPDEEWIDFFEMIAGQIAIAIDSINSFDTLSNSNNELMLAYDATLEGWVKALELRDDETEGHTQRVTSLTLELADALEVSDEQKIHIRRGALLHDIGKLAVPDYILFKSEKLTTVEWTIMRQHPVWAYEWLSPIAYLRPALDIPYCHHEKWDGTGYPRGLKGKEIPLAARIFAVVDVWDALTSDRPYRKAWPKEKVFEQIRKQAGEHFDPVVVSAFLKFMDTPEY